MPTEVERRAERIEAARLAQLRSFAPEVFGPGTMLYIGASPRRSQFLAELLAAGREITILEIWPANAAHFRERADVGVVCGDVRKIPSLSLPLDVYDVAFWWHGPEHVARADLAATLAGIERRARMVVLGCPWGLSPQAEVDGNKYQCHVGAFYPRDFYALGYRVDTFGQVNHRSNSNILAVKP